MRNVKNICTNLLRTKFVRVVSFFLAFVLIINSFLIVDAAPTMRNTSDTKNNSEENNSLSDEVIVHSGTLDNQDVMEKSHSASDTQQSVGENKKLVDILDKYGKPLYNQDVMENDKYVNGMFTLLTDLKQYRAAYSDLYAVYGENWKDYLNHYLTYGFYEKRNSFGYFDARAYANRYPDVKAAFGDDVTALYRHYIMFGLLEGRNGGADGVEPLVFDANAYANRYSDLKYAFGNDVTALYKHFIKYGLSEGRNAGRDILKPINVNSSVGDLSDFIESNTPFYSEDSFEPESGKPNTNVPDSGDTEPDDEVYTRAEWIYLLMQQCGLNSYNNDSQTNYFADTKGHQYEKEIEIAKSYNIIPVPDGQDEQDVPVFNPDNLADREFAAVTSVLALRYSSDGSELECADSSDLQYPKEDKIAVTVGLINLENNFFYPRRVLTTNEKNYMLEKIDDLRSIQGNEEPISNIEYAEDVVALAGQEWLNDYDVIDKGNGKYTITLLNCAETMAIEAGNCFVLPANNQHPSGMALKAVSVTLLNDKLVIDAEVPVDIAEVISHLEYEGKAEAIPGQAEALIEDVSVDYDPNGGTDEAVSFSSRAAIGGSFPVPGKWTFNFGEGKKIGDNTKLSGKVEVTIPDVTAYLNMDFGLVSGVTVNELTFSVTEKAKFSGKLEHTVTEAEDGSIEFARIPFVLGTTGLSIDLVFSLYYDVKGNISINYTIMATEGIQYVDNNFRFIGNFDGELDIPKIEGSGQVGLKPAINLVYCEIWDIIGVDGKIGAAGTVSLTEHTNPFMTCIDGTVYLAASCGLNQDTIIGEFVKEKLHYTLTKEFYNSNNSPLKLKLHYENGQRVETCTYGIGKIKGYVYNASSREPIKYARVSVYCGDSLKAVTYTDSEGAYEIASGLPTNEYVDIKISATGYSTYTDRRILNRDAMTFIEAYMLVGRGEEEQGTVTGSLIDAITGEGINGVTIEVREGWGNISSEIILSETLIATDYNLSLPAGNYTVLAKHDDYIDNFINITVVAQTDSINNNISLYPSGIEVEDISQLKIVLTWGDSPRDIDSHLFGPNVDGTEIFHIYYGNRDYYGNGDRLADLDRDDVDSYGPETTTVHKMNNEGKYSFYVHDYTNRYSIDSNELSLSDAKVVVYNNDRWLATYNIPMHIGGTVWHVFDYDVATSTLMPSNAMYYNSNPNDLGISTYDISNSGELTEEMAIKIITETSMLGKDTESEVESDDTVEDVDKTEEEVGVDTELEVESDDTVEDVDKTEAEVGVDTESEVESDDTVEDVDKTEAEVGVDTESEVESDDTVEDVDKTEEVGVDIESEVESDDTVEDVDKTEAEADVDTEIEI